MRYSDLKDEDLIEIHRMAHDAIAWNKSAETKIERTFVTISITTNHHKTVLNNSYGYIVAHYDGIMSPVYNIFEIVKYCRSLSLSY